LTSDNIFVIMQLQNYQIGKDMLREFLEWCEKQTRAKGETFAANHLFELLGRIRGLTQEEGMQIMTDELVVLQSEMRKEHRLNGHSPRHGELWHKLVNVEQAIRGGNGELYFAGHVPKKK